MIQSISIFTLGLIFGSFFNVVGLRVPKKESIVWPGSHCPSCGQMLTAIELIPVVSYLLQRGKCRRCHAPVSIVYPLMEIVTGALFLFAYVKVGMTGQLVVALTLISLLVIIFVSDLTYMIIPDKVLLVFALIFFIERIFLPLQPWWDALLGAAIGFSLLLIIAIVSKGGMGGGDIKLFAVLGFVLGTKLMLLTFFFSTLFGAVFGIGGMIVGKLTKRKPIPFGPFIALATLVVYFYGTEIIAWYFQRFM